MYRIKQSAVIAAALSICAIPAHAQQSFPVRPLRVVVFVPAGGGADLLARVVSQKLGDALGQTVVVDNRPGSGGMIATEAVAKSAPDGYTLLLGSSGTVTNAPAVYKNISYDPVKDLTAIGPIQYTPMVLTAALRTPAQTWAEFAALRARMDPRGRFTNDYLSRLGLA